MVLLQLDKIGNEKLPMLDSVVPEYEVTRKITLCSFAQIRGDCRFVYAESPERASESASGKKANKVKQQSIFVFRGRRVLKLL